MQEPNRPEKGLDPAAPVSSPRGDEVPSESSAAGKAPKRGGPFVTASESRRVVQELRIALEEEEDTRHPSQSIVGPAPSSLIRSHQQPRRTIHGVRPGRRHRVPALHRQPPTIAAEEEEEENDDDDDDSDGGVRLFSEDLRRAYPTDIEDVPPALLRRRSIEAGLGSRRGEASRKEGGEDQEPAAAEEGSPVPSDTKSDDSWIGTITIKERPKDDADHRE
jgi:hypothetical protein